MQMYLVLCDVCKKNTNREFPIGTLTRTFRKKFNESKPVLANQEFVSEILPMTTINENQERVHVCIPCFSTGMVEAAKTALPAGSAANAEGSAG
jgi:hypothetical protein